MDELATISEGPTQEQLDESSAKVLKSFPVKVGGGWYLSFLTNPHKYSESTEAIFSYDQPVGTEKVSRRTHSVSFVRDSTGTTIEMMLNFYSNSKASYPEEAMPKRVSKVSESGLNRVLNSRGLGVFPSNVVSKISELLRQRLKNLPTE